MCPFCFLFWLAVLRCVFAYSHCSTWAAYASTVLRIRVARLRVFVVAIGVMCAPRLLFNRWGRGCVFAV